LTAKSLLCGFFLTCSCLLGFSTCSFFLAPSLISCALRFFLFSSLSLCCCLGLFPLLALALLTLFALFLLPPLVLLSRSLGLLMLLLGCLLLGAAAPPRLAELGILFGIALCAALAPKFLRQSFGRSCLRPSALGAF